MKDKKLLQYNAVNASIIIISGACLYYLLVDINFVMVSMCAFGLAISYILKEKIRKELIDKDGV